MKATSLPILRFALGAPIAVALVTALLAGTGAVPEAHAQVPRSDFSVTNGTVNAQVISGTTLYVGGSFTRVGPITGSGAPIDSATGAVIPSFPQVAGQVNAIAADGQGGWFIGGLFTTVGGVARANLAHIRADNSLSPWNPATDGQVLTMALDNGTLYVGGGFANAGGAARARVAAIDTASGLATAWNPGASDLVRTLIVSGSTVYLGGRFLVAGGVSRTRLAAIDVATGTANAWNPGANLDVFTLVSSQGRLYAGGTFTVIGGRSRTRLAAIDSTSNIATAWNPGANAQVSTLVIRGDSIWVGGTFTQLAGQTRNRLGMLLASAPTATSWNPGASAAVSALVLSGSSLYAGGDFLTIAGQARSRLAAFDVDTGTLTAWDPGAFGSVLSLATSPGRVYAGGSFSGVGGLARNNLAAFDLNTGLPTTWNPNVDGAVFSLARRGGVIYVGGQFTSLAGQPRTNLGAVDAVTSVLQAWNPGANDQVSALAVSMDWVYAGGLFTTIGGVARQRLARIDASSGVTSAWAPEADGQVFVIDPGPGVIYAGGTFSLAGGQARNNVAAVDTTTGAATSWNPNANGTVRDILVSCGTVYLSGFFTSVGVASRNSLAALDATTGALSSWNPNSNGPVYDMDFGDGMLYVGGVFSSIGGQTRNRIAALDPLTGLASAWNPNSNGTVRVLASGDGQVFASGQFTTMGSLLNSNFAVLPGDASVGCSAIAISPTALPDGVAGIFYSQPMTATGGTNPVCWSVTDGSLPAGLTLSSTGLVSGTPLGSATGVFTVTCTDARGCTSSQTCTLNIFGSAITSTVAPDAHGLCINPAHTVVTVPLVYTRTDTLPARSISVTFQIDTTRVQLHTPANPAASVNLGSWFDAFPSAFLQVVANGGGSYTADATVLGLPCGLSSGGQLLTIDLTSAGPDGKGAISVTRVQVRDCSNVPVPVAPGPVDSVKIQYAPLDITPTSLPAATTGSPYHQVLAGVAGTAPYHFALAAGTLPPGITLSTAGVLDGSPTLNGNYAFTVAVTDTLDCAGSRAFTLAVNCPVVAVATVAIPDAETGTGYTATFTATGATPPLTWAVTSGALPDGLTLTPATGIVSGTPTTPGTSAFSIGFTDAYGCGTSSPWALTVFAAPAGATLAANPVGLCLSTVTTQVGVPFVLTRTDTTSVHRLWLAFALDTTRLALATPATPAASIHLGAWFGGFGAPTPLVTAAGNGTYVVDVTVPPGPCGPGSGGTALTVDLGAGALDGAGAITVLGVKLFGCAGDTLPVLPGAPGLLTVNRASGPGLGSLAAAPVVTGNGTGGTTGITLTWAGGATVALYRAPWASYPAYAAAAAPDSALAPAAPWTLVSPSASSPYVDHPGTRGFWYYVAFTFDSCGNRSLVSNHTAGTLDYVLGDVTDLVTPGAGDNTVGLEDVTLLGANYGIVAPTIGSRGVGYLDVGPTTDAQATSRPVPDGKLDFEDLMLFTANFATSAAAPPASALPATPVAAAGLERFQLQAPSLVAAGDVVTATLSVSAAGRMHGFSAALAWDADVVEPVSARSTGWTEEHGGLALSPAPGVIDAARLGRSGPGFTGDGDVARFAFRALRAGDPAFRIGSLLARDAANRPLSTDAIAGADAIDPPGRTLLLAPQPNPFGADVALAFSLATSGELDLSVYDIHGRHVRTLAHGVHAAGVHHVRWDGRDAAGAAIAPGVYYARFTAAGHTSTTRLVHLR